MRDPWGDMCGVAGRGHEAGTGRRLGRGLGAEGEAGAWRESGGSPPAETWEPPGPRRMRAQRGRGGRGGALGSGLGSAGGPQVPPGPLCGEKAGGGRMDRAQGEGSRRRRGPRGYAGASSSPLPPRLRLGKTREAAAALFPSSSVSYSASTPRLCADEGVPGPGERAGALARGAPGRGWAPPRAGARMCREGCVCAHEGGGRLPSSSGSGEEERRWFPVACGLERSGDRNSGAGVGSRGGTGSRGPGATDSGHQRWGGGSKEDPHSRLSRATSGRTPSFWKMGRQGETQAGAEATLELGFPLRCPGLGRGKVADPGQHPDARFLILHNCPLSPASRGSEHPMNPHRHTGGLIGPLPEGSWFYT